MPELPALDGITLIDEDHYGYCSADSCLLGNDRSGALLMYTVDTDRYTMLALAEVTTFPSSWIVSLIWAYETGRVG